MSKFWLDHPQILFNRQGYYKIIPSEGDDRIEVLNKMTRFFLYAAVLMIILALICPIDVKYFLIIILAIVTIILLHFLHKMNKPEIFQGLNDKSETTKSNSIPFEKSIETPFEKYLYNLPETCKENTERCLRYEDVRFHHLSDDSEQRSSPTNQGGF